MSITLTTTPLSDQDILIEWSYSTFDQETIVQKSTDGINWSIVLSPLPAGTNSVVASGLTSGTKYYFRIKKTVWVGYTKANGDSDTFLNFKTGLSFDGVNDYASIANITLDSDWSINMLINPSDLSTFRVLFATDAGFNTTIYLENPRQLRIGNGSGGIDFWEFDAGFGIDVGEWNMITITRASGMGRVYFNGIESNTGAKAYAFDLTYNTLARASGGLNGLMDEFVLWKGAVLSESQITELYNGGLFTDKPQLIESNPDLHFRFNEGAGGADNTSIIAPELVNDGSLGDGTLINFAKTGTISNWVDSINTALDVFTVTPLSTTSITFTVDANPSSLDVEFEYSKLADFSVIDGSGSTTTSVAVTELDINTLYYFRAQNTGMTGYFKVESSQPLIDFKTALNFDGVNDHYLVNNISADSFETFQSGSMWIKFNESPTATQEYLFVADNSSGSGGYFGILENNAHSVGMRQLVFIVNPVTTLVEVEIPDTIGVWFNVVWAMIPTGTLNEYTFKLSVNGGAYSDQQTYTGVAQTSFGATTIGGTPATAQYESCVIDQLCLIKDVDLVLDEVAIYNGGLGKDLYPDYSAANWILYHDMNEGVADGDNSATGTEIVAPELVDRSGNSHTGTLQNMAKKGTFSNWVDSK